MPRSFKLYPEEKHWWSMQDYGAVLDIVERLQAKRVVEFGPGSSTLSLIEGGATHIDTYEDKPDWHDVYAARLVKRFPGLVRLHRYTWSDPLRLAAASDEPYDLALVDGPHGTLHRPAVISWCLAHARAVLLPTEEAAYGRGALRPHIERIAAAAGWTIEWMQTGPLSGGFALMTPPRAVTSQPLETAAADCVSDVPGDKQPLSRRARRKARKTAAAPPTDPSC